jgi:hypothetical protein
VFGFSRLEELSPLALLSQVLLHKDRDSTAAIVVPLLWSSRVLGGIYAHHRVLAYAVAGLMGAGYFFVWNIHLFRGSDRVPTRSAVGLTVLTLLAATDLAFAWQYGAAYQGVPYTVAVAAINALALTVCWVAYARAVRHPSFPRSLTFHWLTAVWFVWLAFPWLGELI